MARRKAQSDLRETDRVASEQLSVTLEKGQTAKIKREAKGRGLTVSAVVRDALAQYPFVARGPQKPKPVRGALRGKRAKADSRVK